MTRTEFDKLDQLYQSIKVERDKLKIQKKERIDQINSFFESVDSPLKNQYYALTDILANASVEE